MGEIRKIVVEHFPVDRLPEELRRGLDSGQMVRITVECSDASGPRRSLSSLLGAGKGVYTEAEAVSYIRKLRDE